MLDRSEPLQPASSKSGDAIAALLTTAIGRWVWPLAAIEWLAALLLPRAILAWHPSLAAMLAFGVVASALQFSMQRALRSLYALHELRVPRALRYRSVCLLGTVAAVLGLPALILLLRLPGLNIGSAIGMACSWVALSALVALVPQRTHALFMPLLVVPPLVALNQPLFAGTLAWMGALIGALLAPLRWRRLLLQLPSVPGSRGLGDTVPLWESYAADWSLALLRMRRASPVQRGRSDGSNGLRALLGKPFAYRSWPMRALQWLWGLALLAALLLAVRGSHCSPGGSAALIVLVTIAVFALSSRGQQRLLELFGRSGGDCTELALLPGLGDGHAQHIALARCTLLPALLTGALASGFAILAIAWAGAPATVLILLLAWCALALALAQIARRRTIHPTLDSMPQPHRAGRRAITVLASLLAAAWLIASSIRWLDHAAHAGPQIVAIAFVLPWLGALSAMAYMIVRHDRHARRLPHPFLQR